MIDAARALADQGVVPANVDDPTMCRVPASVLLPEGESWITATEKARQSDAGVRVGTVRVVSAPPYESDARRDLAYYEAVPYLLVVESIEREGEWLRQAEHPELPGCVAEAPSVLEAMDRLERERRRRLRELWDRDLPIPRAPLAAPPILNR